MDFWFVDWLKSFWIMIPIHRKSGPFHSLLLLSNFFLSPIQQRVSCVRAFLRFTFRSLNIILSFTGTQSENYRHWTVVNCTVIALEWISFELIELYSSLRRSFMHGSPVAILSNCNQGSHLHFRYDGGTDFHRRTEHFYSSVTSQYPPSTKRLKDDNDEQKKRSEQKKFQQRMKSKRNHPLVSR